MVTNENFNRNMTMLVKIISSMMIMKAMTVRVENFEDFFRKSLSSSQWLTLTPATQRCTGQQR